MTHLTKPEPANRSKIDLRSRLQVKHWAHALKISQNELRHLVERVGNSAAGVRKEVELMRLKASARKSG